MTLTRKWPLVLIDFDMVMHFQSPEVEGQIVRQHFLPYIKTEKELYEVEEDAQLLFDDVKRFLFLCAFHDKQLTPPGSIEEGWICFMDYPRLYDIFCDQYLGYYVAPYPEPDAHVETVKELWSSIEQTRELAAQAFQHQSLSHNWFNFPLKSAP